ncbi:MAG: cytidine deaminase [Desulfovibrionaceae bacterium]
MTQEREDFSALLQAAKDAAGRAYAPYSGFRVGAAVLDAAGRVFTGCNVENASYGLSLCAERAALAAAVAGGAQCIQALALWFLDLSGPGEKTPDGADTPCGACRQWLVELAPEAVVVTNQTPEPMSVDSLLPNSFRIQPKNSRK